MQESLNDLISLEKELLKLRNNINSLEKLTGEDIQSKGSGFFKETIWELNSWQLRLESAKIYQSIDTQIRQDAMINTGSSLKAKIRKFFSRLLFKLTGLNRQPAINHELTSLIICNMRRLQFIEDNLKESKKEIEYFHEEIDSIHQKIMGLKNE